MSLLEQMKPEFRGMIKKETDSYYYESAMDELTTNDYFHKVTFGGIVAITSFTHPDRPASLLEFINIFEK